jgi:glutamate-ammonia-ligase adenylyltransferase
MRPSAHHLQSLCPDVPDELARAHLKRLDDEYFERFDLDAVVAHVNGLARLSEKHPVDLLVEHRPDGYLDCTILSFDYPSVFSLITGVLCGAGAAIVAGDVFTYAKAIERRASGGKRPRSGSTPKPSFGRRRIVDHFWCTVEPALLNDEWVEKLRADLAEVISLLESGDRGAAEAAKQRVNQLVTRRLIDVRLPEQPALFPVDIGFDNDSGPFTRLTVVAQDTPAFLYSFSNALALQDCSIERVRIRTSQGCIRDEIDFVDASGSPVLDTEAQFRIKLCALLTKQFTYFLEKASDPFSALSRFEQLVERFLSMPQSEVWIESLADPRLMGDLARILGASDFLWEDFIRLQYESLLPILAPHIVRGARLSVSDEDLPRRLDSALVGAKTFEERVDAINAFKDEQIFRIDLEHILDDAVDFRSLSERLTALAEEIVRRTTGTVYDELVRRHGTPRTVAGLEASCAVFGLGKLGGCALGYASDIELLVVYGDNGETDGDAPRTNTEFFSTLARELAKAIRAKREGIFEVDLRLRPHGAAGPMASSLEQFCSYYGPGGGAHSVERLALVRMRAIAGDRELGAQVERLRDQYLYFSSAIDGAELNELREKQYKEKRRPGVHNAKFSAGALVDLEYTVQHLQVLYGEKDFRLRTSSIHQALRALEDIGVLEPDECARLVVAYEFLRELINGLRMLRGTAKDLYLPDLESDEFVHLARRMGYEPDDDRDPQAQLHLEFETRTAAVRTFVAKRLGPESLPGPLVGNAADLILADDPSLELRTKVLGGLGFRRPESSYENLRRLAGDGSRREVFCGLAVLACDRLRFEPDPDMALNNWERFLSELTDPEAHYRLLLAQPRRLGILVGIFSRSQFLADALIRNPEFLDWVTTPINLGSVRKRGDIEKELRALAGPCPDHATWLKTIRVFRRRETLRIGVRDMCLRVPTEEVVADLSALAGGIVHVTIQEAWKRLREEGAIPPDGEDLPERACILAFGKLGGRELNYSSDIDLLCVYDEEGARVSPAVPAARVVERLVADLSSVTDEGYAYRVDLRLRPWGGVGEIVSSINSIERYYRESARLWEVQALLKIRPIAGNQQVGYDFVERLRPLLVKSRDLETVSASIETMREQAMRKSAGGAHARAIDVKNGRGGIRDIEFLAQGLQLVHLAEHPALLTGNTLNALEELAKCGVLSCDAVDVLHEDYIFLRRVEHYLQILHDRQTHSVPLDGDELEALARRVLGPSASPGVFREEMESRMRRVRGMYERYLLAGQQREPDTEITR